MEHMESLKKLFPDDYKIKFYRMPGLVMVNMYNVENKELHHVFLELKNDYPWKWKV